MRLSLLFATLLVGLTASAAHALVLVKDGQPVATLVVATDSALPRAAAGLIQHCVQRSSGATLPIVTADQPPAGATIQIGATPAVQAACPEAARLKTDGVIARVKNGHLCLAAQNSYALKIAAVRFLEEQLGVRWLFPTPLGEIVPTHQTIAIPDDLNLVEEPDLDSRMFSGIYNFDPALLRLHLTLQFHHNLYRIIPVDKYAQTHPEYFPMINGVRRLPTSENSGWQPETTNPDVVRLTIEAADKWFTEHPEETSFSLGVTDSGGESYSPEAVALDKQLGPPTPTNRFYTFYNQVAEGLERKWPNKLLGILNYPPLQGVPTVKLHRNLLIYCWRGSDGGIRPDEWYGKWPNLAFCDWLYGCFYCMPRHYPHAYADLIRRYRQGGFRGMYAEAYPNWPLDGPKLYALARVMWKLDTDVTAAVSEYLRLAYGPAAPAAERFFARAEQAMDRRQSPDIFSRWSSSIRQDFDVWTVEDVAAMEQAARDMEQAVAGQPDSDVAKRVKLFRDGWDWYAVHVRMAAEARALREGAAHTEAEVQRVLQMTAELVQLPAQRDRLWDEVVSKQESMLWCTARYRELIAGSDPAEGIRDAIVAGLEQADRCWNATLPAAQVADKWAVARRQFPQLGPGIRIRQALTGGLQGDANLLTNPGFEAGQESWGLWVREGTQCEHKVDGQVAHTGKQSVWVGPGTIACYTYSLPVQPGEAFYIGCWARRATEAGTCALKVWWKSAEDKNLPAVPQWERRLTGPVGEWQKLEMYGEVPATAGRATILLVGQGFGPGGGCWFDDTRCFTMKME